MSHDPSDSFSHMEDLHEFILAGPLLEKLGLKNEPLIFMKKWLQYGSHLCELLSLNKMQLTLPEKIRVYHFYIPLFLWCERELLHHQSVYDGNEIPPLVIGINGPQGSGKTTLVSVLDNLFRLNGRNSVTLSIDDFYLTADNQARLRDEFPGNSLLEYRGNAGSHDLKLAARTMTSLKQLTRSGMKIKIPRYNKSAHAGKGDRADMSTWPEIEGPLSIVLLEGWMLGFKSQPVELIEKINTQLVAVNRHLEKYFEAWDKFVESWLIIKIKDLNWISEWRLQAELSMIASGLPGMTNKEVQDFVSRFMPAYTAFLPTLYSEGPIDCNPERVAVIEIDFLRNPV